MRPGRHLVRDAPRFLGHFIEAPAHEALDRIYGVLRICYRLSLCDLSDSAFAALGDRYHRTRRACTLLVGDYDRFAALHHRYDRVRRAQVNSNNLTHDSLPPKTRPSLSSQLTN